MTVVFIASGACDRRAGKSEASEKEAPAVEMLNVSYDPTRELYQEINPLFATYWKKQSNRTVNIKMSHGGAGKQARSVMDGLEADVVTLALEYDLNAIADKGLMKKSWRKRLPNDSAPYVSTIVFLVRKGNPKHIQDWDDLVASGVQVITPNPKTSGGARWNYLAGWAYALKKWGSEDSARSYLKKLYGNVPVLDSGARGATNTFVERGIGDVLLAWENEALLAARELGAGKFDIVYPSMSILAEPPVAVVDANCKKHQTCDTAAAYLMFLYSEEIQRIVGKHNFRPRSQSAAAEFKDKFPDLSLVTVDDVAGGWNAAQKRHFVDGGEFDRIYADAGSK
ncbi:MAG: sulfate ABC transporter substrate-binding protein [Deltaproteobacteria bacterium]|nr:sulfate ABC transporter substrate-binding protein [Deltaproteobacteria bacterium]MBN2672755.1 sulfate ABC transporter substrate-binding protein [Deltaproteobacteria bacterium]